MKKLTMIINPKAGTKRIRNFLPEIIALYNSRGWECSVYVTTKRGDAPYFAGQCTADSSLVVCAGGDGTFNEVVSGMLDAGVDLPIGYIPAGSTNDFASGLHLSSDIMKAATDIMDGHERTLDLGKIDDRYFSYVASVGIFTKPSYSTSQNLKNAIGYGAYIIEGAKDLATISPIKLRIECEERLFEGEYIFGAISNSTSIGGILTLDSSVVDMNDGRVELLFIKSPKSLDELLRITNALSKKHYDCDMIDFVSTSKVTVTGEKPISWTLDGELYSGGVTAHAENLPHAVRVMVND